MSTIGFGIPDIEPTMIFISQLCLLGCASTLSHLTNSACPFWLIDYKFCARVPITKGVMKKMRRLGFRFHGSCCDEALNGHGYQ